MAYSPVFCPIPACKALLGSAHHCGHIAMIRRHVHQDHPDVAAEASKLENEIRDFRKRYGRGILRVF
jgi:hypothetical protein